jgi:hypothetical protein
MLSTVEGLRSALEAQLFTPGRFNAQYIRDKYETSIPSKEQYVFDLACSANIVFICGDSLQYMAKRLEQDNDEYSARHFKRVHTEEYWHGRLLLHDVQMLGYDLSKVLSRIEAPVHTQIAQRMVGYHVSEHPLDFLGVNFAFERMTLECPESRVKRIEEAYGTGKPESVTSLLTLHCGSGTEKAHVEELLEFMVKLPEHIKVRIALEVGRIADLLCTNNKYPGDIAMREILEECEL